jgi:RNA polymerase sigma-70 factor (ECF subfamily)
MSVDVDLHPPPDPDGELMSHVAAGSEPAFVELIHRHQGPLLNFFTRMGVYNDAEDLVQETFVRLYRGRARYRRTAKFTTFLYVLARHVWADRGRQAARRERLQASLKVDAETAAERRPHRRAAGLDVEEALAKLSPKLREVVVLNVYQGLPYQDIADTLGIPLGTVKSRLNLAMEALRESLDAR